MHWWSVAVFTAQLCGYVALSTALEWGWYHRRSGSWKSWKIQPPQPGGGGGLGGGEAHSQQLKENIPRRAYEWGFPAIDLFTAATATLRGDGVGCVGGGDACDDVEEENGTRGRRGRRRRTRHPRHGLFATVNLLVSAMFAGAVTEVSLRECSQLYTNTSTNTSTRAVVIAFFWALAKTIAWQSVWEYYWHRLMHHPPVYRLLHKHHHHYKSPQPWDDLFIHPLEALGYYIILYSPAFCVGPVPAPAFLTYMALLGTFGVLDHCGVGASRHHTATLSTLEPKTNSAFFHFFPPARAVEVKPEARPPHCLAPRSKCEDVPGARWTCAWWSERWVALRWRCTTPGSTTCTT